MPKFRKKPVVIEAYQLPTEEMRGPTSEGLMNFLAKMRRDFEFGKNDTLIIHTLEGDMTAQPGDWIIKGVNDEHYPCKPDIFEATYEQVND
ncbi:MAG: hypothetical protein NXI13_16340 [Proteobacteria bacterium]|nr:hypothetical protein [Pseudomonadota bacterium]